MNFLKRSPDAELIRIVNTLSEMEASAEIKEWTPARCRIVHGLCKMIVDLSLDIRDKTAGHFKMLDDDCCFGTTDVD